MNNDIHRLRLTLSEKRLSRLIDIVQKHIDNGPAVDAFCIEELDNFKKQAEYMRMYAFAEKKDPYRQQLFDDMVNGLHRLSRDVVKCTRVELSTELRAMKKRSPESDFDLPKIRRNIEDYVSSMAMSSITGEDKSAIVERHFKFIERLFDYIITGRLWNESKQKFFSEIISSPVIDAADAQVLVSAITMSTLLVSDELKIETLLDVYTTSSVPEVKVRALVGWVLGLHAVGGMCDRLNERVHELVKNADIMAELLEIQMQIYYCAGTEKDTDTIKRDIIPGLFANRNIKSNRFGIVDNEEDEMKDLLKGSDDADRSMEEIEKNLDKIKEMEMRGSDVYFGGFENMKHYSFFYNMVNWFYPFISNHPDLQLVIDKQIGARMIRFVENCPFCNSDKYSYALAMATLYQNIPDEIKQIMNSEPPTQMMPSPERPTKPFIRRMYLQDLYRFYKLNASSKYMDDPFKEQNGLLRGFFFDDYFLYCEEMKQAKQALARFFVKKRPEGEELSLLFDSYESDNDDDRLLRAGYMLQKGENGNVAKALEIYRDVYTKNPEREGVLNGIVRCLSHLERYEEACSYAEELVTLHPDTKSYQLNYSIILIKCNRCSAANKILFKLHYEYPEDRNIMRVLAWNMLMEDKKEKSIEMFDKIMESGKVIAQDNLNAGFAHWVSGKEQEAADYFVRYAKVENLHKLTHEIDDEREFLKQHDIIEVDMCMMLDLVEERINQA